MSCPGDTLLSQLSALSVVVYTQHTLVSQHSWPAASNMKWSNNIKQLIETTFKPWSYWSSWPWSVWWPVSSSIRWGLLLSLTVLLTEYMNLLLRMQFSLSTETGKIWTILCLESLTKSQVRAKKILIDLDMIFSKKNILGCVLHFWLRTNVWLFIKNFISLPFARHKQTTICWSMISN